MKDIIFEGHCHEGDVLLLKSLKSELMENLPFVIWLQGEMGAGKTALVRSYLYFLGLDPNIPVVSPTYTLLNEYRLGEHWFAHMDLYRLQPGSEMSELGIYDAKQYAGIFIEWPENTGGLDGIFPTHTIEILKIDDITRHICFSRKS